VPRLHRHLRRSVHQLELAREQCTEGGCTCAIGEKCHPAGCHLCGSATKCCDSLNQCGSGNCGCFLIFEDRSQAACVELIGGLCADLNPCTSTADCGAGQCCVCTCCDNKGGRSLCLGCIGVCMDRCFGAVRAAPRRAAREPLPYLEGPGR
jgi:hypothetical protein